MAAVVTKNTPFYYFLLLATSFDSIFKGVQARFSKNIDTFFLTLEEKRMLREQPVCCTAGEDPNPNDATYY